MDKMTIETTFFRSISVQLNDDIGIFPLYTRSFHASIDFDGKVVFRTISVHFYVFFSYLCTGKSVNTSTYMAGTVKEMSLIKQVLQLKQLGESNRGIARKLPINKETVNGYMNTIETNGWDIGELLKIDDPELERMFHAGSPAYTDARMKEFLRLLPYFREQLTNRKLHVTRQLLWEEYRQTHPDGYGKSQFYDHLKQNLVAQKDVTTVLAQTYKPGEKLMIDFAGDKLSYIDTETGEIIKVEVFVACMPYSDYIYVICVPSQRTEDFLFALRMCLEHLGGVPPIVVPDNLKAAKLRGREFHSLLELNAGVEEQNILLNQTRMPKRPYTREERFHAMEKPLLQPLPEEVFEMRYYADLKVGSNNFVELRHDKVTHFYSAPYIYIGRMARVIFTRSWVKIYVDNQLVATHTRKHDYGHTYEPEHMASNSRAIMECSAAYYVSWAGKKSEECKAYISEIFNPQRTNKPEEVYYRLCGAILSSYKKYESSLVDLTCRQCLDNRVFTYKKFEAILKHNYITQSDDEPCLFAPVPTDHVNMRGSDYFK